MVFSKKYFLFERESERDSEQKIRIGLTDRRGRRNNGHIITCSRSSILGDGLMD